MISVADALVIMISFASLIVAIIAVTTQKKVTPLTIWPDVCKVKGLLFL